MISRIAEVLRDERRRAEAAMSPDERIRLALQLGARDLSVYCSVHGVTRRRALLFLRTQAQHGRASSKVMAE